MRYYNLILELGAFTVLSMLSHIKKSLELVKDDILEELPLVPPQEGVADKYIRENLKNAIEDIKKIKNKEHLVLVGPELIFIETLLEYNIHSQISISVHHSLNDESLLRLYKNVPRIINVDVIKLPEIPHNLRPDKALITAFGFNGGSGYTLIPNVNLDILNHYNGKYFGEILLINPIDFPVFSRPNGWITVRTSKYFTYCYNSFQHQIDGESHGFENTNTEAIKV